ncbi:MAG: hypothetical protein LBU70_01340 [Chitinispirillales bacterium]|jgi:hypothetical protein|nr:hypothetical protein [Chitinispirillales bacterium]
MNTKKTSIFAAALLITALAVTTSHALVGAGIHWGFDLSMSMDDDSDRIGAGAIPGGAAFLSGLGLNSDLDLFRFHRSGWDRSVINFGGKVYIDFIPVIPIDAIEISCNFGLWQYNGVLEYISGVDFETGNPTYSKIPLGLEQMGMKSYFGMGGLPYAKLHFDVTLKRQLLNLWLIKFDGGMGMSAHFATPLLSAGLIEDVIGSTGNIGELLTALTANDPAAATAFGKEIVEEIRDNTLGRPAFGAHILLGARAKLPVIPIGIYVDGKFMMPFGKFIDKDEGKGINGWGILLNTGISLSI